MHVTSLGTAREIQEGIAVDPLLVGCGVKPHDFDFDLKTIKLNQYLKLKNSNEV
ncbi:hypothetical protein NUITMVS3_31260 [Shewanella xiamenensis]|nr:hypothetical protein NUITMVS2_36580 [Shewanella xiamenensis]GLD78694.1 hypothetical protein NUITMVS3_31260 [Shewanella xiamenensis]